MRLLFGTFLLLFGTSFSSWSHGYHVSITQIDYNEKTNAIEIAIKLITEDVEFVLEEQGAERLFLGEKNETGKADEYIQKYLEKHFSVVLNDEITTQLYLGKEIEEGETWYYIEIKNVEEISSLVVKSTFFIETYHSQTNRVDLNILGKTNSFVLSRAKVDDKVVFN